MDLENIIALAALFVGVGQLAITILRRSTDDRE